MTNHRDRSTNDDEHLSGEFAGWYQSARPDEERRARALRQLHESLDAARIEGASPRSISNLGIHRRRRSFIVSGVAAAVAAAAFVIAIPRWRSTAARDAERVASDAPASLAGRPHSKRQPVGFTLQLTEGAARHVSVAGDFNGWNAAALPMLRDASSGVWRVRVLLPPGRHAYSYVIDGTRWVIDPLAPRTNEGELGPTNVITIAGDS